VKASKVLLDVRPDGVAILTLNDPEHRNPLSDEGMISELLAHLRSIETNMDLRALVLTGVGSCFSAGGNIHQMQRKEGMFAGSAYQISEAYQASVQQIPLILSRISIPTIAAVNGPAMGAGCDLAMMCDMRLATQTAQFGEVFVRLGLVSGDGGGWFLLRHLGYQRAAEISFRGRPVHADEALELGLVLEIVPDNALMEQAISLASEIAAQPPAAIRMTKRLLKMAEKTELPDYLAAVAAMQAVMHGTDEHSEALSRLIDKNAKHG